MSLASQVALLATRIGQEMKTKVSTGDPRLTDTRTPTDGSVSIAKIADGAVTSVKLASGSVTTAKIGDGQVTSAKIADGTIVNADIGAAAGIVGTKLAAAVQTSLGKADSAVQGSGLTVVVQTGAPSGAPATRITIRTA